MHGHVHTCSNLFGRILVRSDAFGIDKPLRLETTNSLLWKKRIVVPVKKTSLMRRKNDFSCLEKTNSFVHQMNLFVVKKLLARMGVIFLGILIPINIFLHMVELSSLSLEMEIQFVKMVMVI